MKLISFLVLLLSPVFLFAQPRLMYLTPDIGAPGMSVYVEFYAPDSDALSFSLSDTIQVLNSNGIKIECVTPSDTNKISFGPLLVSWRGRLLSTIIYVSPLVTTPNSHNWKLLTSEFKIPIRITTTAGSTAIDTFYLVRPTHLGDITSISESVIGQGNLGLRSRRGCIIVDSLILGNKEYTISTNDPDGSLSNGNQGYLPFTLLSQGVIKGTGSNSKISVNGNGRDGGPGGGGGAGQFCDILIKGPVGGDGFTGGGGGGKNTPNDPQVNGQGSGPNGSSLTEVASSSRGGAHESSGGGTGHPFGKSGDGCDNGPGCSPIGFFGGASGVADTRDGAGGGYATAGANTSIAGTNGGKIYGNSELIPLAGGSGGASGNVKNSFPTIGGCGGDAGGGGGAISISAFLIKDVTITANGADGVKPDGISKRGGAGSGGGIILTSLTPYTNVVTSAIGGNQSTTGKGGDGRIRVDGIFTGSFSATPSLGNNGITMDSVSFTSTTNFPISGTGATNATIDIYLKPSNGIWQQLTPVVVGANNRWASTISYSGTAQYLYVVALQRSTNTNKLGYEYVPTHIMSQQSARIIKVAHIAQIDFPTLRDFGQVSCTTGGTKLDTFLIKNTGSGPITLLSYRFTGNTEGFTLIEPVIPSSKIINALDSQRVIVRFSQQAGKYGNRSDFLQFTTDDANNPFTSTELKVQVDSVGIALLDTTSTIKVISTIDFDRVCSNSSFTKLFTIKNIGKESITVVQQRTKNTINYQIRPPTKTLLPAGDTTQLWITLTTQGTGDYSDTLIIEIDKCNLKYAIPIRALGISSDIVGYGADIDASVNFGDVRVSTSKKRILVVKNEGNYEADIRNIPTVLPPFILKSIAPDSIPRVLAKGDSVVFELEFLPLSAASYSDSVKVVTVGFVNSCPDTVIFRIYGRGTKSSIVASKSLMNFDTVYSCSRKRDTVWLKNTGNIDATVKQGATIKGNDPTYFRIISAPVRDTILRSLIDSVAIIVEFIPDTTKPKGAKSAILEIPTFDDSARTVQVLLSGYQKIVKYIITPNPLILADIPVNISTQSKVPIVITNIGDTRICLSKIVARDTNVLKPIPPFVLDFDPTVQRGVYLSIKPKDLNIIRDTLTLYFSCPCVDSIKIPFQGQPTNNALAFNQDSIYFGDLQPCAPTANAVPQLSITNYDPISRAFINDIYIIGKDSSLFSVQRTWSSFPITVNSGGSGINMNLFFNPHGTRAGLKNAKLIFKYTINNQVLYDTIMLAGYRHTPITTDSINMDFGSVKQSQLKIIPLTITNDSSRALTINYAFVASSQGAFKPAPQSLNIAGRQKDVYNIEFSNTVVGKYKDTMYVKFTNTTLGCWDSLPVYMKGEIIPGLNFRVWLDSSHQVSPNDKKVRIGLWGKLDTTNLTLPQAQFQATIDFPADLFMPNDLAPKAGGVIQNFSPVLNGRRAITINIDTTLNPIGPNAVILAEIIGDAMLGNTECDSAFITDILWKNNGIRPTTWINKDSTGGKICVDLCKDGGDRVIGTVGQQFAITLSPNPTQGDIEIEFTATEKGRHEIIFTTAEGKEVERITIEQLTLQSKQTILKNTEGFANGLYFVTYQSATQSKVLPLLIHH